MVVAKVVGSVLSSEKADEIEGDTYRLVEKCDHLGNGLNDYIVSLDMVNSTTEDIVLLAQGSSCSWTDRTNNKAIDSIIIGIIDLIDERGKLTYKR